MNMNEWKRNMSLCRGHELTSALYAQAQYISVTMFAAVIFFFHAMIIRRAKYYEAQCNAYKGFE